MHLKEPQKQELRAIPDGIRGIKATLAYMSGFVREGKTNPKIRGMATQLTMPIGQRNFTAEAKAQFQFVRDNIRYLGDITDVETIQSPQVTLDNRAGDCDDKSTLLAALLESIGHKTRFVAVGFRAGQIDHVYVETIIGDKWIAADATEPVEFGWYPPGVVERIYWHN